MSASDKPRRFRVIPQEQGMTLRNLLIRRVRELDRERASELIRAGGVYVNRLRVRLPQVLVAPGERITVYLEALDAAPLEPAKLVFVHREPSFVVLDKPPGVPVSAVRETAVGSLSEALIHQLESEGVTRPYVGVVHRLDQGASGLVLFTIRSVANKSLHRQFVEHEIQRGYRVRVRALPGSAHASGSWPEEIVCDVPLIKLAEGGVELGHPSDPRAKPALTRFRHVYSLGGAGSLAGADPDDGPEHLLDVRIETGRTHQIRAHAAALGFPVLGDHRYGQAGPPATPLAERAAPDRLCLHAWTLDFRHPLRGEALHFESPLPAWAKVPHTSPQQPT